MLTINETKNHKAYNNVIAYITENDKPIGSVSFDEKNKNGNTFAHLNDEFKFEIAPRPITEKERMVLFCAGESGAGKSYFVREFAKRYNHMFPKNPIYLISYLNYDETLDEYEKIKRIDAFNYQFLEECMKINLEEFRDSFVIFDDIDSISNKNTKSKIYGFLFKLLRLGRHQNISVAYVGHELYASPELKNILNESMIITFFPKFLNYKKLKYLLEVYFGLSKEQIERIQNITDTRPVSYIKGASKVIVSDHEMFIL